MQECKRTLLRAIQLDPTHTGTWYNLALSGEAYAVDILQRPVHMRAYREVKAAEMELHTAFDIFMRLSKEKTKDRSLGDLAGKCINSIVLVLREWYLH